MLTPISLDLSDPVKIVPQDRKWEQTRQELAGRGLVPATKEFSYVGTIPMTRAEKIGLGENFGNKPVTSDYHGDWYEVQPEETEQNLQVTGSTVQFPVERGIMLAGEQYNEIVVSQSTARDRRRQKTLSLMRIWS